MPKLYHVQNAQAAYPHPFLRGAFFRSASFLGLANFARMFAITEARCPVASSAFIGFVVAG
jgi:hypothetical protein